MKLDILAIGAHPDDVELGCAGTLMKQIALGHKVGILDLTRGELGTRGTPEVREQEAAAAATIIGVHARENLAFEDGFFSNDKEHQMALISAIRKYQPEIVITTAWKDRHPDHERAAKLTADACFLSGLAQIATKIDGQSQQKWRPKAIYHYIQAIFTEPDFVVDISEYMERKMDVVAAYKSQFYDPSSKESPTFISTPEYLQLVKGRASDFGIHSGFAYGEGFTTDRRIGVKNLFDLF